MRHTGVMSDETGGRATVPSRRDRLRAEIVHDIKRLAMVSIADDGAAALSLRGIARELGIAPSALYRYFPSRDAVLAELIADAYNELGHVVEAALEPIDAGRPFEGWMAAAHATRAWALAEPNRWGLVYGTPIPGFVADLDVTLDPAMRITDALTGILVGGVRARRLDRRALAASESAMDPALVDDFGRFVVAHGVDLPPTLMVEGIAAWSQLIGIVSFEVFGHLDLVTTTRDELFEFQAAAIGRALSLGLAE
jgi:AcrR family transcriptional regulator